MDMLSVEPMIGNSYRPGPALAICSPISKSLDTGFPGKTLDNCETVLLTVEYNLFITSIAVKSAKITQKLLHNFYFMVLF